MGSMVKLAPKVKVGRDSGGGAVSLCTRAFASSFSSGKLDSARVDG